MTTTLRSFLRRLEERSTPEQWARVREREASRLGISATEWSTLREMKIDLLMVREAHRVASTRSVVRRAERDGEWALVSAQAGRLRSQPQGVRIDEWIEPAWDHVTLKQRLAELVNTTRHATSATPIPAAAALVRGLVRAQPFLGDNERVALLVASVMLRSVGLPALHGNELERGRLLAAALRSPDDTAMVRLLTDAAWTEALDRVESLLLVPPENTRWTLAAEHAALTTARQEARAISDTELAAWSDAVYHALAPHLAIRFAVGSARRMIHASFEARARAAADAVYRGRAISAQNTVIETRWPVAQDVAVVVVVAHAGLGISGAASAHLSLELPSLPTPRVAPAILLVPDEPADELEVRLSDWSGRALDRASRDCPMRLE